VISCSSMHYSRASKADADPRAGSEAGSRFGPAALALFVIVAIVAAVVGLYALSSSRKRAAEAQKTLREARSLPELAAGRAAAAEAGLAG
jgi:hypothetical protein